MKNVLTVFLLTAIVSYSSGLDVATQLEFAVRQYTTLATTIPETGVYISTGDPTSPTWNTVPVGDWTAGFYAGSLWTIYKLTNDNKWRDLAERHQVGLFERQFDRSNHDVGFVIMSSYGLGLELTENQSFVPPIIQAATSLAGRFFRLAGVTRSWSNYNDGSDEVKVIVDNMMNLDLLFKATDLTQNNYYRRLAISHAEVTMRDHFREDGGTYHVVAYYEHTGQVKRKYTAQGYATESTWARGLAWAIHGFTTTYKHTNDPRFLLTAMKGANYFINHLPVDHVPFWDFDAPLTSYQPRDTSAAAVASVAFLELFKITGDTKYFVTAENILESLASPSYRADGLPSYRIPAILVNGTVFFNQNNFNTAITYGDFYFLTALDLYQNLKK